MDLSQTFIISLKFGQICRRVRRGGALGARALPHLGKKFRPDMSAKTNVHVPLRYDRIKMKKVGEKEEKSKRKGVKLKK